MRKWTLNLEASREVMEITREAISEKCAKPREDLNNHISALSNPIQIKYPKSF